MKNFLIKATVTYVLSYTLSLQAVEPIKLLTHDLVEVTGVEPSLVVELLYSSSKNFTNDQLYPKPLCFLHIKAAQALAAAHNELKSYGYKIMIWDGYRPISMQDRFSQLEIDNPSIPFYQDPKQTSKHARGTAVSVLLLDKENFQVPMPTKVDIFNEKTLRSYDLLSEDVLFHRLLLEVVMERHGFTAHPLIWWHFDLKGHEKFPVLDEPLENLIQEYEAK
jgi:D-alanyl-D-alanine dipeptidase